MAFCSNCGKPNTDQAVKCVSCGTDLKPAAGGVKFKGTMMMSGVGTPGGPPVPPGAPGAPPPAAPAAPPAAGGFAPPPSPPQGRAELGYQQTVMGPMGPPPGTPGGFGAPPAGGATFGAPPAAPPSGLGTPPAQGGGFGAPPAAQSGGFGAPPAQPAGFGAPPAQPAGFGAPPAQPAGFGAPPPAQPAGFGAPPPAQPAGFGAPPPAQSGGFGAPPAQGGGFGAPPAQGGGGFGAPSPQGGGFGAPPAAQPGFSSPPPAQKKGGAGKWIAIGCGVLLLVGGCCVGAGLYAKNKAEEKSAELQTQFGKGGAFTAELNRISLIGTMGGMRMVCISDPTGAQNQQYFHPSAWEANKGKACAVTEKVVEVFSDNQKATAANLQGSSDEAKATALGLNAIDCTSFTANQAKIITCAGADQRQLVIALENLETVQ